MNCEQEGLKLESHIISTKSTPWKIRPHFDWNSVQSRNISLKDNREQDPSDYGIVNSIQRRVNTLTIPHPIQKSWVCIIRDMDFIFIERKIAAVVSKKIKILHISQNGVNRRFIGDFFGGIESVCR